VTAGSERYVFVIQHRHERFDLMPFSIARTWREDKGLDIAIYSMYDAVELLKKDVIIEHPDIRDALDALLANGVPVYAYYPGVQVGNRHIFHSLMTERQSVNW
jgi:predicted peroxiredoxin